MDQWIGLRENRPEITAFASFLEGFPASLFLSSNSVSAAIFNQWYTSGFGWRFVIPKTTGRIYTNCDIKVRTTPKKCLGPITLRSSQAGLRNWWAISGPQRATLHDRNGSAPACRLPWLWRLERDPWPQPIWENFRKLSWRWDLNRVPGRKIEWALAASENRVYP